MELAASQKLQAHLYTDSLLRKRFYADPVTVGAQFGLSEAASLQLAKLPQDQVKEFTKQLRRKRLKDVSAHLPRFVRLLGRDFGELFKQYVLKTPPPADQVAWQDALRFTAFVLDQPKKLGLDPPWARHLLRYEAARIRTALGEEAIQMLWFPCRIRGAVRELESNLKPERCLGLPSLVIMLAADVPGGVRIISL